MPCWPWSQPGLGDGSGKLGAAPLGIRQAVLLGLGLGVLGSWNLYRPPSQAQKAAAPFPNLPRLHPCVDRVPTRVPGDCITECPASGEADCLPQLALQGREDCPRPGWPELQPGPTGAGTPHASAVDSSHTPALSTILSEPSILLFNRLNHRKRGLDRQGACVCRERGALWCHGHHNQQPVTGPGFCKKATREGFPATGMTQTHRRNDFRVRVPNPPTASPHFSSANWELTAQESHTPRTFPGRYQALVLPIWSGLFPA